MDTARLWFARIVMLYALLIFCFLSYLYIVEPLEHIERFGISADGSPESIAFLRVAVGGLFLGMAITALCGLALPARLIACLSVIVLFDGCVVAMRLLGIAIDGAVHVREELGAALGVLVADVGVEPIRVHAHEHEVGTVKQRADEGGVAARVGAGQQLRKACDIVREDN